MTTVANNLLTTPVGRIVQGSLYEPQTTDMFGQPLVFKTGAQAGQPRKNYFFALAIEKGTETHWSQTVWGAVIYSAAHASFPNGLPRDFAWKIVDGDSQEPNKNEIKPCSREGYPRHWVLLLSSAIAPSIWNADGTAQLLENDSIQCGDYAQVRIQVGVNDGPQNPSVFLNHKMVALAGYGVRIKFSEDAKNVGFGSARLPAGASPTPIAQGFNPGTPQAAPMAPAPIVAPTAVTPYPAILTPPPPVSAPPARVMLEKAGGVPYEKFIEAGWNDVTLVQHGIMAS